MRYKIGDRVRKHNRKPPWNISPGGYEATGTIVAAFTTLAGAERYVFEFDGHPGLLHVFSEAQLDPLEDPA